MESQTNKKLAQRLRIPPKIYALPCSSCLKPLLTEVFLAPSPPVATYQSLLCTGTCVLHQFRNAHTWSDGPLSQCLSSHG